MKYLSFIAFSLLATTSLAEHTATLTSQPPSALASTTFATSAKPTSVIQATRQQTSYLMASASSGGYSSSYGSNAVDTEGGASGADTSTFNLSKGGLIAIIVVVVTVAVFGIASVVLYILAKRRQWDIRQSLKRASRRLTGRSNPPSKKDQATRRKRSGIVAGAKSEARATPPLDHKRAVVVEVKDEEQAPPSYGTPPNMKKPREKSWVQRLWGNDWK